ncbi:CbtB domain-containing protein [Celeribacter litoreus]|uniref:CbtB domain-containing protein n=1 Tax=Celeribacter litoreus TaxID=2876714 RepID=UPI001CC91449|nr:CbtB domain-containing protein [Celeribacter litoreus]MCA0042330.1 CbtB-domain containing protein [Celeribacter litoreus]
MTKTFAFARLHSELLTLGAAAFLGLGLVFAVGLSHNASAHDFAHDSRHAIGFPCH